MVREFEDYLIDLEAAGFRTAARRLRKVSGPEVEALRKERKIPESLKEGPIVYQHSDFSHDANERIVILNGRQICLNPQENALLCLLEQRPNKICPYDYLLKELWGPDYKDLNYDTKHLGSLACQLRSKIEPEKCKRGGRYNSNFKYVVTDPGIGLTLKDPSKLPPENQ